MKKYLISAIIFGLATSISCTRKNQDISRIQVQFPEKRMSKKALPVNAQSVGLWGLNAPTTIAEIDCYGILVAGSDLAPGNCSLSDNSQVAGNLLAGQFSAGSNGVIEVPAGKSRSLAVFGFVSNSGTCENQFGPSFDPAQFSAPLIVGQVTADLSAGDVTVTVPVSMTAAKTIVSCSGSAYGNFPKTPVCNPTLASASYLGQGQIQLTGTCLDQSTGISLVNVTDSVTTTTSIVSKSATQALVQMATSLAVSKAKNYQILIATAQAQVATPVNLQVENDLLVYEGATLLGKHMEGPVVSGKPSSVTIPLVIIQGSTAISYGIDTSGGMTPYPVNMLTSYYLVDSSYIGISLSELRRRNLIYKESIVYFSASNCTGEMAIPAVATQRVHLKYVAAPDCMPGPSCTDRVYKVTGSGTFESSFSHQSSSNIDMMNGRPTCSTTGSTVDNVYNIGTNFSDVTASLGTGGEPPATVSAIEVRPQ